MLLKLLNLGNHQHNCEVLRQKTGDLVVLHRPAENVEYTSFVTCIYCYAYLSKSSEMDGKGNGYTKVVPAYCRRMLMEN